jgi:hypothetical protein
VVSDAANDRRGTRKVSAALDEMQAELADRTARMDQLDGEGQEGPGEGCP